MMFSWFLHLNIWFSLIGDSREVELLKQQLEEMRDTHEGYTSVCAELEILKLERNEIVQMKEAEIEELKAKLNDILAGSDKSAGKMANLRLDQG